LIFLPNIEGKVKSFIKLLLNWVAGIPHMELFQLDEAML
jgi:hypothetical protein